MPSMTGCGFVLLLCVASASAFSAGPLRGRSIVSMGAVDRRHLLSTAAGAAAAVLGTAPAFALKDLAAAQLSADAQRKKDKAYMSPAQAQVKYGSQTSPETIKAAQQLGIKAPPPKRQPLPLPEGYYNGGR
jgi:hypothetical protein